MLCRQAKINCSISKLHNNKCVIIHKKKKVPWAIWKLPSISKKCGLSFTQSILVEEGAIKSSPSRARQGRRTKGMLGNWRHSCLAGRSPQPLNSISRLPSEKVIRTSTLSKELINHIFTRNIWILNVGKYFKHFIKQIKTKPTNNQCTRDKSSRTSCELKPADRLAMCSL